MANTTSNTVANTKPVALKVDGSVTKIAADPVKQHDPHDPVSMGLPPIPALPGRP